MTGNNDLLSDLERALKDAENGLRECGAVLLLYRRAHDREHERFGVLARDCPICVRADVLLEGWADLAQGTIRP